MNSIELFGVISGFITVYLTIKENIWCWPTGIINVIFFFIMFYQARLYADMGLQVFFLVLSIYGWYNWLHGGKSKSEVPISKTSAKEWLLGIPLTALSAYGLGLFLSSQTDASVPFWDSSATMMSIFAQYLLARKRLENYLVWMAVDVLSIGIYLYKDLYLTSVLYLAFLILVIIGFITWRKHYQREQRV